MILLVVLVHYMTIHSHAPNDDDKIYYYFK